MILVSLVLTILASSPSQLEAWELSVFYTRPEKIMNPKVDLSSHPIGRRYRTHLEQTVASGVNFAGRYSLVKWGCGTSCSQFAIVDLTSGRIWHDPNLIATRGLAFRPHTRLLVFNPHDGENLSFPNIPEEYLEWTGNALEPVRPLRMAR